MQPRIAYLDNWTQGMKFGCLVFHAGVHDMPASDRNKNLTEAETLRQLHIKADLEKKFPTIPHVWIDIPLQGGARNPNTADGVMVWLANNPRPAVALCFQVNLTYRINMRFLKHMCRAHLPSKR